MGLSLQHALRIKKISFKMATSNKVILHIDDDADDREMLSIAFHDINANVQVVEKENGLAGLQYLCDAKVAGKLPCLIVLDVNMPFLDGKQTLAKIREHASLDGLKILVYTSSNSPHDQSYFAERGVELITKPAEVSGINRVAQKMITYCD
jgi:CheY-like chemotaxis protein